MLGLLSAGISGVGAIAGGLAGRSAAKKAAQEQRGGYNAAISALGSSNSDAAGILRPYSDEGAGARSLVNAALGVPTLQGGISQSGVADEGQIYQRILTDRPDVRAAVTKEISNRKSPLYGMSLEQAAKWWSENAPDGRQTVESIKASLATSAPASAAVSAAPQTQADASQVFQGTQFAKDANAYSTSLTANAGAYGNALDANASRYSDALDANSNRYGDMLDANAGKLSNALWQPIGGEQATYAASPWQAMSDRATTKANDLFLGLAGAQGNVLSGNTARGLQENKAYIDDSFHSNYLNAYNNAATGSFNAKDSAATGRYNATSDAVTGRYNASSDAATGRYNANNNAATGTYNANTDAFANWMNGLDGVSNRGFQADNTVSGNVVGQGNTLANIATGNGQAQAEGVQNASNATQNMIGGVFNALGQGVQALATPRATTQQPKTNALYMGATHQNAAPVRLRAR